MKCCDTIWSGKGVILGKELDRWSKTQLWKPMLLVHQFTSQFSGGSYFIISEVPIHLFPCEVLWHHMAEKRRYPRQQETLCRSVKPNFRLSCWKWHCQVEKVRKTKDKFCQLLFLPPLLIRFMVNVRVTLGQLIRAKFPPPNNCLLIIWVFIFKKKIWVFMGTGRCLSSATFLLLGSIWRELGDWPHQDD